MERSPPPSRSAPPAKPSGEPSMRPSPPPSKSVAPTLYFRATSSRVPISLAEPTGSNPPLNLTFQFSGANATTVSKGDSLQQLQAAIGCTVQVPLEYVVLTNITQTIAGTIITVPFDRTIPTLNSNGIVVCLVPARRHLQSRVLQASSSSINVFVMILSPSNTLVSLNSTALTALVENSYSLQLVSSAVGSSGLSVANNDRTSSPSSTTTASTASTADSTKSSNLSLIVGLSVFAGCCLVVISAIIIVHQTQRKAIPFSRSNSVLSVENPASVSASGSSASQKVSPFVADARIGFTPSTIRIGT